MPPIWRSPRGPLARMASSVGRAAGDLLFPHACQICEAEEIDGAFCESCRDELCQSGESACPRCAEPVGPFAPRSRDCSACRKKRFGFDGAIALGPYQGPIREVCLRMKNSRDAWLARWVGDLLVEAREPLLRRANPSVVVAVPLHWSRRLRRGYNQAEAIARRVALRLALPRVEGLRRTRRTPKLADLGRAERVEVLNRAFRATPRMDLAGRTVLLVDDVLTSGATCGGAARALKQVGAKRVIVLVVGRA